ncbi:hypothetical protein DQW50_02820 [Halorubrum sp. 48-1-W]|uniref:DUF7511 domain-containing protein n=1 Tax=Halorubrum sp. 48-1-W TaxID=2249761 RepID=UPI000DCB002C|nr:hypothetical protein [Halorubrum sp. 48-1-W]RAW46516.1 hypothetical protein DQW50_02820 [Halorubrum sp. 48-1-W]
MSTSPMRVPSERPEIVCRSAGEGSPDAEVTFFEADRDPDERTTRWITVRAVDCVPREEWR